MTASVASLRGIASKDTPQSLVPSTSTTLAWTRPSDWLTITTVGPTDQKFVGLYAVMDDGNNYVALKGTTSTGTYSVDWGDGTTSTGVTSGSNAQHQYSYTSINPSTYSTRGYRQVVITVTADTGNLTGIDLQQKYTATTLPTLPSASSRWLDINVGSPNMTSLIIGGTTVPPFFLERCNVVSLTSSSNTIFSSLFSTCKQLQSVIISSSITSCTSTASMFLNCYDLKIAPFFNTSNVTTVSNMFAGCYDLQSVPTYNLINVTVADNMFNTCRKLKTIPLFNTSNLANAASMFLGCTSLTSLPVINTSKVTNGNFMFALTGIIDMPKLDFSVLANANAMFQQAAVQTIPAMNTANVTDAAQMFLSCSALQKIESIDLTKTTTISNMFSGCNSLDYLPNLNTSNTANFANAFLNCQNLTTFPTINTSNATILTNAFQGCTALTGDVTISIPKVTNMASLFNATSIGNITFTDATTTLSNAASLVSSSPTPTSITGINANSCVSAGTITFTTGTSISTLGISNIKIGFNVSSFNLSRTALEGIFANSIIGNTLSQTVTITSATGADPVQTKASSGITANSNVITMSNTSGLTAGMYVYGTGLQSGIPVTFTDTGDKVQYTNALTNNPLIDGARVMFTAITSTTGISTNTMYYVVNASSSGFQVSSTSGGSALPLTTNGTGTMTIGNMSGNALPTIIQTVNSGNIIITGIAGLTNAAATVTARQLNYTMATVKNFAVTG